MLSSIFSVVAIILSVPFYTLLERKVLSYIQLRKGPNKVGVVGILQPITDGVKLLVKEGPMPIKVNTSLYWLAPSLSFILMVLSCVLIPLFYNTTNIAFSFLVFLCISSVSVYTVMSSGWSSNSKYGFLGAIRGSAQSVSYEISLLTLVFIPFLLVNGFSFKAHISQYLTYVVSLVSVVTMVLLLVCETNRAPVDFAEGESELVSGFNTEFGGLLFTFLFLAEYGNILIASLLVSILFFTSVVVLWGLGCCTVSLVFLFLRGAFPRFRYDLLMNFSWGVVLPLSVALLFSALVL